MHEHFDDRVVRPLVVTLTTATLNNSAVEFTPSAETPVDHARWDSAPFNRWTFQNMASVMPTAAVRRGDTPRPLPVESSDVANISFLDHADAKTTVDQFIERSFTDGIIVLHRGAVVLEQYRNRMTPATLHLSQSVAKSIVATTAGALIGRGELDPSANVDSLAPRLAGTAYEGAQLQTVLDMRSGVRFTEDYLDPTSDVSALDRSSGWKPGGPEDAACVPDFIRRLGTDRPHGSDFSYRSIETEAIALVLEAVSGLRLPELVSREIWSKIGAGNDANFTVDRSGHALADGGFNATLRDYARFGQMHLNMGAVNGEQVVAADWILSCRTGDNEVFQGTYRDRFPNGAYQNQFWVEDLSTGAYSARGVFGQQIHIDPAAGVVIVKLSSWPLPSIDDLGTDTYAAMRAIVKHLSEARRSPPAGSLA